MEDTTQIILIVAAIFLVAIDITCIGKIRNATIRFFALNFWLLFTAWMIWQVVF